MTFDLARSAARAIGARALLGLFGYITHTFFFFRQQSWWSALLQWVSAMPGAAIRHAVWLNEYDYYYKTVPSFDLGLPRMARTWLYLTPSPGQIYKAERQDRANRGGYYGLHGLDVAFLYRNRPLWDIVVVGLLLGLGVSTLTSLVPACRRLARHARKLAIPALRSSRRPVSAVNQES